MWGITAQIHLAVTLTFFDFFPTLYIVGCPKNIPYTKFDIFWKIFWGQHHPK